MSLGQTVNRVARLLRRLADRKLAELGLSSGHLPVLTALIEHEPLSQKALVEQAGIEQPTMAATLGRMERDGIIARTPNPSDRRTLLYSLTSETRAKIPDIQSTVGKISAVASAGLTADDSAKLVRLLGLMADALDRELNPVQS